MFLACLAAAGLCGLIASLIMSRSGEASKGFLISLVVLPMVVCTVILMVNGSVGTGIAVAGAFSLVRFRSVAGKAKDISAIFLVMTAGLACAAGYVLIALLFTMLVSLVMLLLSRLSFGEKALYELHITVPETLEFAGAFDDLIHKGLGRDTRFLCFFLDLLAMFIRAGKEHDIIAPQALALPERESGDPALRKDGRSRCPMRNVKKIMGLLWALLLFGFTAYAALDTFVIEHTYTVVEEAAPSAQVSEPYPSQEPAVEAAPTAIAEPVSATDAAPEATTSPAATTVPVSTENSYADGNVSITIQEIRVYDSTVYVADVVLSSPEYLQTAFANSVYGRNVTAKTSSIARNANAILAVNGDYYGARQSGYVIRNGVLYRDKANKSAEDLVIYQDGTFGIVNESHITAQALLDSGAWNVLSFGPALLIDGEIAVDAKDEVGRAKASNPRTAIGIMDDLHYLFVVSDGRTNSSEGLSLKELAQVLQDLGAKTAYNLDGGGSSTMVFQGRVVNNPTTNGKRITERSVSDIVCIAC